MTLKIDTTNNDMMTIALVKGDKVVAEKKIKTRYDQAAKLLPSVSAMLKKARVPLRRLAVISVANRGGSFTSLRIGVVTANALGFALNIPVTAEKSETGDKPELMTDFDVVEPAYDREPNITIKSS